MDAKTYADLHRGAVGGGEIMTVAGLNQYQSPRELWEVKIGERDPADLDNWHIDRGTFREPGNLAWASKRVGIKFAKPPEPYRRGPFVVTPDGVGKDDAGIMVSAEIKCPSDFAALDWGSDGSGSDGVPIKHLPQVTVEIGAVHSSGSECPPSLYDPETTPAYGYAFGDIGGFIRAYRVPFDPKFYAELEDVAVEFLRHVKNRTPPPIDGSKASAKWLARKFPKHASADLVKVESDDVEAAIWKLKTTGAEIKAREKIVEKCQNVIKDALGKLPGYVGDFGKIYWKKSKDSDPKPDAVRILTELKTILQLRASVGSPAAGGFAELLDEIAELEKAHTMQKIGARTFRSYWKK